MVPRHACMHKGSATKRRTLMRIYPSSIPGFPTALSDGQEGVTVTSSIRQPAWGIGPQNCCYRIPCFSRRRCQREGRIWHLRESKRRPALCGIDSRFQNGERQSSEGVRGDIETVHWWAADKVDCPIYSWMW